MPYMQADPTAQAPNAAITARITGFVAHLRLNGLAVGTADSNAALNLLGAGELESITTVRNSLKVLFTGCKSEWQRFDELFEAYWLSHGRIRGSAPKPDAEHQPSPAATRLWSRRDGKNASASPEQQTSASGESGNQVADPRSTPTASTRETLHRVDLRQVADPSDMARAQQIAYRLAKALRYKLSRRRKFSPNGNRLDLRRTIRRSLARGGDPLTLVRQRRPNRPVRVVLMLDASGSMRPYTPFLLQFARGLARGWNDSEVFLFHTRVVRITEVLREKDAMLAMSRLALMARGMGGGTRLGECLRVFNDQFAKRTINSRTVFVMLSDGYDTGDPSHCVEQLARLKRRLRRLIWLNPLLGWERYQPITRTMHAALPFIDHFAPAHSLDALGALEQSLQHV